MNQELEMVKQEMASVNIYIVRISGPHLGLRQEPQVSSPFLTQIEACLQSWDWILRPRLV